MRDGETAFKRRELEFWERPVDCRNVKGSMRDRALARHSCNFDRFREQASNHFRKLGKRNRAATCQIERADAPVSDNQIGQRYDVVDIDVIARLLPFAE